MWTKVCGIRDQATAELISRLPIDAVGLNFFPKSVRSVTLVEALPLATRLKRSTEIVGLFVNHDLDYILKCAASLQLDWIQLHGDEPPSFLSELKQRLEQADLKQTKLIKAFRIDESGLGEVKKYLQECEQLQVELSACLLDAAVKGEYGGTGHQAPWEIIRDEYQFDSWPSLILAGGLKPDNVKAAITSVRPWGIDLASGVESSPGQKDPEMIQQLAAIITEE